MNTFLHGEKHSTGTYLRTQEEKYNEFLSKLGVGMLMRKAATSSTPTMEITESGGKWKIITKTTLKSTEINFQIGVPFDETSTDGRKCKTTVTQEGNVYNSEETGEHIDLTANVIEWEWIAPLSVISVFLCIILLLVVILCFQKPT